MSATNRGSARRDLGFYQTPTDVTDTILDILFPCYAGRPIPAHEWPKRILEPMAGKGAIVARLRARGCPEERITCFELDPERVKVLRERFPRATVERRDFLGSPLVKETGSHDLVITNPDFAVSLETAQMALRWRVSSGAVALLLKLDFMHGVDRYDFHVANPSRAYVLRRRPSFVVSFRCEEKPIPACAKWREVHEPDEAPKGVRCGVCGGPTSRCGTDAQAYAWFVWGLGGSDWRSV